MRGICQGLWGGVCYDLLFWNLKRRVIVFANFSYLGKHGVILSMLY